MDAIPLPGPGATDAELKLRALSGPDGNFWTFAGSWFVLALVVNAAGSATCGIGSLVLAAPAAFGLANLSLRAADHHRLDFADGFAGFNDFGRALAWWCLVTLYVSLWSLLLVVPGIVKSFSYAMSPFLLVDHPEMGAAESIDESRRLMDGNKGRLFVLCLSFLGWGLLCLLTLGILSFWLVPYMHTTIAAFYRSVVAEKGPPPARPAAAPPTAL